MPIDWHDNAVYDTLITDQRGDDGVELWQASSVELIERLKRNEVSSREVLEAHLARIEDANPSVNAVIHRFDEAARDAADELDAARRRGESRGPFCGLPVSIKDSIDVRGAPTTLGIPSRRDRFPDQDAVVVRVLRERGAIPFIKTNVSQALLFHESDNPLFGQTLNPWDHSRSAGGSSGGEAAAIAAGMSPAGIGTDIGGSVRVPASFCGIAGLKPTSGRWSIRGCASAIDGQEQIRSSCGPMARTARDVAYLFLAADGPYHARHDPYVPAMKTGSPARVDVSKLRVGVFTDDDVMTPSPAQERAVSRASEALRARGVEVVPFEPPLGPDIAFLYFASLSSDGARTLKRQLNGDHAVRQLDLLRWLAWLPKPIREVTAAFAASQGEARLERLVRSSGERRLPEYWRLAVERDHYRAEVLAAWKKMGIDAVLCPTHATSALPHGASRDFWLGGALSIRYSVLDFPSGTVPVTRVRSDEGIRIEDRDHLDRTAAAVDEGSDGLPVGVQIAARPFREDRVLALMIALEDALRDDPDYPSTPRA